MGKMVVKTLILVVAIFTMIKLTGCATAPVAGQWHNPAENDLSNEISVAADTSDEHSNVDPSDGHCLDLPPQYYDKKKKFSVRFMNDEDNILICLNTHDETMKRKLMMQGFSLWIDPDGGERYALGITVPGKLTGKRSRMAKGDENPFSMIAAEKVESSEIPEIPATSGASASPSERFGNGKKRPPMDPEMIAMPNEIKVTYPDTTAAVPMTMEEAEALGIVLSFDLERGYICQLDVPFSLDPSLASLKKGGIVGVGFESAANREGNEQMGPPAGMGRGGSGMMGMGRSGMGKMKRKSGHFRAMMEPYKVWLKVELASG